MRAIRELRPNGYGATVQQAIERAEGRVPSLGRIYVEFMRLEEAGMVETREVAGSPERGGRRKLVAVLRANGGQGRLPPKRPSYPSPQYRLLLLSALIVWRRGAFWPQVLVKDHVTALNSCIAARVARRNGRSGFPVLLSYVSLDCLPRRKRQFPSKVAL